MSVDLLFPYSATEWKVKVYLTPDEQAPKGIRIQEGPRGGRFYHTEQARGDLGRNKRRATVFGAGIGGAVAAVPAAAIHAVEGLFGGFESPRRGKSTRLSILKAISRRYAPAAAVLGGGVGGGALTGRFLSSLRNRSGEQHVRRSERQHDEGEKRTDEDFLIGVRDPSRRKTINDERIRVGLKPLHWSRFGF